MSQIICLLFCAFLFAASADASPDSFNYQGRIVAADGTPLEHNNVSFSFAVTNETGTCTFYQEQTNHINMQGSNGVFDIPIGLGVKSFPTSASANIRDAFKNSVALPCSSGSTYTPAENEIRLLKVQFHDGTGWKAITPNSEIRSVPFATYSYSAGMLGNYLPSDFVLKNAITTCATGQYLTYDGTNFSCMNDSGGAGTITDLTVTAPLTKGGTSTIPALGINVGTTASTVAAGNDSRFGDALKIHGTSISATAPSASQYLKYDGSQWLPASISTSDVSGLSSTISGLMTQSSFNATVSSASCGAHQSLYWSSVSGSFLCQAINVSLVGDVSGTIGATTVDKIKGISIDATTPTTGQVLKYDGSKWAPSASSSGTVTSVSGTTGEISVATGTSTPVLSLDATGTAGTYYKVTTDSKGRVTSGSTSLAATEIPALDFTKITSGLPTTLSGYGITDAVKNLGGSPGFKSGTNASKGSAGTTGNIYISTDTKEIYRDNGTTWDLIGSATGTGGTITGVTAGTGVTGGGTSGAVTVNVDVGTSANKIVQLDSSAKLPGVDGSALTNLNPASLSTVVPITKGGTGQNTATLGFNALSPATTKGDLIAHDSANNIRVAVGSDGQVLAADSSQTSGLKWTTPTNGTVTTVSGTAPISVATGTSTPVISIASGSATGQTLRWSGSAWSATKLVYTDLINATSASPWPSTSCSAGEAVIWSSASDSFLCSTITVSGSSFATQSANLVFAGPSSGGAAAPTFRALASADLPLTGTTGVFANGGNSFGATTSIGTKDSQNLSLISNNATVMTLSTAGYVGIGTSAPTAALQVQKTSLANPALVIGGGFAGGPNIQTYSLQVDPLGWMGLGTDMTGGPYENSVYFPVGATTNGKLTFGTYDGTTYSEKMRVTASGYVGIGTSTPATRLDVNGAIKVGADSSTCSSTIAGALRYENGIFLYCDGSAWSPISPGNLIPENSVFGMKACPTNWTDLGVLTGTSPSCNGATCRACQSPSSKVLVPASAIFMAASCPAGWTGLGPVTLGAAAPPYCPNMSCQMCQSPSTEKIVPHGLRLVSKACPTDWKDISATRGASIVCDGTACRVCESPGATGITDLAGPSAATATGSGLSAAILGGNGGSTSGASGGVTISAGYVTDGNGGAINITSGTGVSTASSRTGGNIAITAGNGAAYAGNGGTVTIQAGKNASTSVYSSLNMQTAGGNVGIGTTSPSATLQVAGTVMTSNNQGYWSLNSSGTSTNIMNLDTSNILTVGSSNPTNVFYTNSTERMRIDSSGYVGIGTASPSYNLHVVGSAGLSSGTAWTNASDARLKDIQGDYEYGLNEILKLHTVRYNYKKDNPLGLPSDFSKTGFIAQEVQKVIPDAVQERKDGYLELNVDPIHWAVVNAVKELYHRWFTDSEQLKRKISSQDQEIIELKKRLEVLEKKLESK